MIDYNFQTITPNKAPTSNDEERELVRLGRSEYQYLWVDQVNWRTQWDQIVKYYDPYSGRYLLGQQGADAEDMGRRKDQFRINTTPAHVMKVYRASLCEGLIPRTRPFYRMVPRDRDLLKSNAVKEWCFNQDKKILAMAERSNFYNNGGKVFMETGLFGSAQMWIYDVMDDPKRLAWCKTNTIGEFVWGLNGYDGVGSSQTKYRMTALQIVGRFSQQKDYSDMPSVIQSAMRDNQPHTKFTIFHWVFPNQQYKIGALGKDGFQWREIWYSDVHDKNEVLSDHGFYTKPRIDVRALVDGCSVYGRGDGAEALGDTKMLQKLELMKTQALGVMIGPPLNVPIGMKPVGVKLYPNAVNYAPQGVDIQQIKPVYNINFDLAQAREEIATVEGRIKDLLHYNEFLAVLSMDKAATAYEIAKRIEEKIMVIGPTLDYLKSEFLAPSIERFYDILAQNNLLDPVPPELSGQPMKVEFTSILSQAQNMIGASTYEQSLGYAARAAQVYGPGVLKNINSDKNVRQYFDMVGMPPDNQVDEDVVAQERAQAAQQQKTAQDLQAAESMSKTAKNAAGAGMGGGTNLLQNAAAATASNNPGWSAPIQ